jgi:hypothetical protein
MKRVKPYALLSDLLENTSAARDAPPSGGTPPSSFLFLHGRAAAAAPLRFAAQGRRLDLLVSLVSGL